MQVAAQHAETVGERAGIGVMERLLLDGVALHSGGVAPGNLKLAPFVEANLANAQLPVRNAAAMAAGETPHKSPVDLLVKLAFANIGVQNILKCGHESPQKARKSKIETGKSKLGVRRGAGGDASVSQFSPTIIPPAPTPVRSTRSDA